MDELITACVASGLFSTADQLVELEKKALAKRRTNNKRSANEAQITSSAHAQKAIKNTVLIRHNDLLRLVETTQLEQLKEESFQDGNQFAIALSPALSKRSSSRENILLKNAGGSRDGSLRGGNSYLQPRGGIPGIPGGVASSMRNRKVEEVKTSSPSEALKAMVRSASIGSLLGASDME